jgi:hypothetical protein
MGARYHDAMAFLSGRALVIGLGGFGILACSGPPNVAPALPSDGPKPGDVFGGVPCSAVRPQTEPDLMGWDPGSRANLNRLRQEGVVAVRYVSQGCNVELEVLSNCVAKGSYKYTPYAESQSKTFKTARELFAEIPISAVRLSSKLKGNRMLRTDYELVGTASLPVGSVFKASELRGPPAECGKATHVVSAVYLGSDKENVSCRVPLRIGLLPLQDVGPVAPAQTSPPVEKPTPPPVKKPPSDDPYGGSMPAPIAPVAKRGNGECPEGMVKVQEGSFKRDGGGSPWTLVSFCMDVNEVTVGRYTACVRAGKCSPEHLKEEWQFVKELLKPSDACNYGVSGRDDHPINCVSSWQASEFCRASGYRLPRPEEWEWVARGGSRGTTYPWGNDNPSSQLCWSGVSHRSGTCPVGSFSSGDSPLGIHDLAGNVWEWTEGHFYKIQGGGWHNGYASEVRAGKELVELNKGDERGPGTGFRCARNLP